MDDFNYDIFENIIKYLPVTSITPFRSTSKTFKTMIDRYIKHKLNKDRDRDINILITCYIISLFSRRRCIYYLTLFILSKKKYRFFNL